MGTSPHTCVVVILYRRPIRDRSQPKRLFLSGFNELLTKIATDQIIVAGDANFSAEKPMPKYTIDDDLVKILSDHGLRQCVSKKTHRDGGLLDIFCL